MKLNINLNILAVIVLIAIIVLLPYKLLFGLGIITILVIGYLLLRK
jgi:hypothetical protein